MQQYFCIDILQNEHDVHILKKLNDNNIVVYNFCKDIICSIVTEFAVIIIL